MAGSHHRHHNQQHLHHHHQHLYDDSQNAMDDSDQETKSDPYHSLQPLRNAAAYGTLMEELTQFLQGEQQQQQLSHSYLSARKLEISPEAERLLRESLSVFVDARPPADFVVYAEDERVGTAGGAEQQQQQAPQDPPLFDGSVANATPPPLDGGPAGGAGTLLHLATALDQPLVLALCLALGGDARACHTAFRRLLIHEAACNGSLHSLTLLLELGREFSGTLQQQEEPRRSAVASLPFLPRRLDRAQALAALPFLAQQPVKQTPSTTNVLELLHHFRSLVAQVRQGTITELQAARAVLKQATLKPVSQRALARACQFDVSSVSRATVWRGGSLDGHGNTPLHWAAFKNETACVSLLLSYGADPNARANPSGWTPLHDAAYSNSVESIGLLIRAGAHVDARANSGATPLCFAAQEDADRAVQLLLEQGANLTIRCAGTGDTALQQQHSRFSGYTPLHYCAHYNARRAAMVLLRHATARRALEIPDLSDRLPIHVAVARGSAAVLRELLHAGARVETRWAAQQQAQHRQSQEAQQARRRPPSPEQPSTPRRSASDAINVTPVSSPVLRSMIPSQPVTSAKPWNCLTQQSIDECRHLISEAESHWSPERHSLFTPADRQGVRTVLLVGQRLEQQGVFPEVWLEVLSFCGRGWFDRELEPMEDVQTEDLEYHTDTQHPHLSLPTF
uniref:Uncharacterized protein n=1 Tax=Amphora coffeiformis TaxID=265554 RepID=A0A7S3L002_9STRA